MHLARVDALTQDTDADGWVEACDAVLRELAQLATAPTVELAPLLPALDRLTPVLADRLRADAWQQRTHALTTAQLQEALGQPLFAARAWMRVGTLVPHREREARARAEALFLRAGAYDEWLAASGNAPNPLLARLVALLKDRIGGEVGGVTYAITDLPWEAASALDTTDTRPFLKAFPDHADAPTVFRGVLSLSGPGGFFIDGVFARETPLAKPLLAKAAGTRRSGGMVRAAWKTKVSGAPDLPDTPESIAERARAHATFESTVEKLLGTCLEGERGEFREFDGATYEAIAALGAALGDEFLDQNHNSSPSPRELLAKAPANRRTFFGGHVVFPPRSDYRVDVVSVTLPTKAVPSAWKESADEVTVRGELTDLWWD